MDLNDAPKPERLHVDPARLKCPDTGFFVRAYLDDEIGSYDIANLNRASLFKWLRSRGGENEWAEAVVLGLLGHPIFGEPYER